EERPYLKVVVDRVGSRSSRRGRPQLDVGDRLVRCDAHDLAGPLRRLLGLEPERGHLNVMLARPDEFQREGSVGTGPGGWVVVAVLIQGRRLGPDLAARDGIASVIDHPAGHDTGSVQADLETLDHLTGGRLERGHDSVGPGPPLAELAVVRDEVV